MNYYARFNSTNYKLIELPNLNDSSSETKFSNIQIDFRGHIESELPIQYQEIKIVQIDESLNETILMTAYCEGVEYPEFNSEEQPFLLTINLLSPYAYSSKRSVSTQINTIALNTAILTVLDPLIDDGFTIEINTLPSTKYVSEIFQNISVEKAINNLANKIDFIWYIDKDKKIYLKDIDLLIGQEAVISITDTNKCYLQKIQPVKTVVDYANRLNIKNVKLISSEFLVPMGTILKTGETYNFTYPISIGKNVVYRLSGFDTENPTYDYAFYLETNVNSYYIYIDLVAKTTTYSAEIGISGIDDDDTSKKILLIADSNDSTKITGFKWNYSSNETIGSTIRCISNSAITPYQIVYIDPVEIANVKGKINTSGVIEKIVDANSKYFNGTEIQNYAVSLFKQNNVQTNEIKCIFKGRLNDSNFIAIKDLLKITNVFSVNLPLFYINGNFIITETSYSANRETATLTLSAKNYNLNESYLDIFRVAITEESEDTLTKKAITFYNQDNKTILSKEIYVNGELVNND